MPLNILYHHRTQGRGAEGVHISSVVNAWRAMGHRVTVVSPPGIDPMNPALTTPVDKAKVRTGGWQSVWKWFSRHLPRGLFEVAEIVYNPVAFGRLKSHLDRERFDLVYERYAFYMVAGAWLARRRGIAFVLEANEVSGVESRARPQVFPRLCSAFERFLFARCASIHTVSSNLAKLIVRQGVEAGRVEVAPNGFDVERVRGRARDPVLAERLGLAGATVVGFAGWFDHWDRLDLLIEVFATLSTDRADLRLLLIGDGPMRAALREKASALGVSERVVFTGAVPRKEVFDYIAMLDIAVLPHSNDFGSPVVMFEFMGLRIPVVAPRLGPIVDVQRDGETALLFDPLDSAQCRAAIERLIADTALRRRLADTAHAQLVVEHTWHRNASRVLESVSLAGDGAAASSRRRSLPSVCLVAELSPPTGGMAVQAERLGDNLRAEGHAVVNVRSNALRHDAPLRRVKYLRGVVNLAMFLALLVRRLPRAEVVHVFSTSNLSFFLFTAPPVLLGRWLGRRVVLHYHGGGADDFLRRWQRLAMPVFRRADALIVPSGFLVAVFARYGLRAEEITNTLALERFRFAERRPYLPRILIARHLRPPYNVACGIRAFGRVAQAFAGATLTVAGAGVERPQLEQLCRELGIDGRVEFVGNIDNERMRSLFESSHLYLNTSQVDNQPVSILEAFACGLPVVSTSVGGIPYMVTHGESGLLAPDNDDAALADHMLTILRDQQLALRLARAGKERVRDYSWPRIYPLLAAIYERSA